MERDSRKIRRKESRDNKLRYISFWFNYKMEQGSGVIDGGRDEVKRDCSRWATVQDISAQMALSMWEGKLTKAGGTSLRW